LQREGHAVIDSAKYSFGTEISGAEMIVRRLWMEQQDLLIWSFSAFFLSAVAMKLLLHRAGAEVNAISWNTSYAREFKDFSALCREEPLPGRILLRAIQVVYVGSFVAMLLVGVVTLFRTVLR